MLGTATVMLGPAADLYKLTPSTHSIGLVKNFATTSEPAYTELTQGTQNDVVFSIKTSNPVRASMEVYEYTAKNLTYALGLDGAALTMTPGESTVATAITGDGTETDVSVEAGDGVNFAPGDYVMIDSDGDDNVIVRRVASVATDTLTMSRAFETGQNVPVGATIKKVASIDIGKRDTEGFLAANIVGRLVDGTGVVIYIPKLRVTRGFNLAFGTDDYANLPFEFSVYRTVPTDPFYADFSDVYARMFRT